MFSIKDSLIKRRVYEKLLKIFDLHCFVEVSTPLLLPKNKLLTENFDYRVDLMDQSGMILHLPFDLRIPFARYVVRNNIYHLKRFFISTVYRKAQILESHPRTLTECALDVITSPNCYIASTAELLSIVSDIVMEIPTLKEKNYVIKINHTSLLKVDRQIYDFYTFIRFSGQVFCFFLKIKIILDISHV